MLVRAGTPIIAAVTIAPGGTPADWATRGDPSIVHLATGRYRVTFNAVTLAAESDMLAVSITSLDGAPRIIGALVDIFSGPLEVTLHAQTVSGVDTDATIGVTIWRSR